MHLGLGHRGLSQGLDIFFFHLGLGHRGFSQGFAHTPGLDI